MAAQSYGPLRVCLVIIDGIADTGIRTPLQEVTPQFDRAFLVFDGLMQFDRRAFHVWMPSLELEQMV
jgi:hypothetical protein